MGPSQRIPPRLPDCNATDLLCNRYRATPSLITALPIAAHKYDEQAYHITVLQHSSNLASLSGTAGRGAKGWSEWMTGLQLNQQDNGSAMYIENL